MWRKFQQTFTRETRALAHQILRPSLKSDWHCRSLFFSAFSLSIKSNLLPTCKEPELSGEERKNPSTVSCDVPKLGEMSRVGFLLARNPLQ
jgi:hypothetical protein